MFRYFYHFLFLPFFFFFLPKLAKGLDIIWHLGSYIPSLNCLSNYAQLHYFYYGWIIAFLKLSKGVYNLYLANFYFSWWIYYKYYGFWSNLFLSYKTEENYFIVELAYVLILLRSYNDMLFYVFKASRTG